MKVRNKEVNRENFTLSNGEYCGNCVNFNWLSPNKSCWILDEKLCRCMMLDFKICTKFHKGIN